MFLLDCNVFFHELPLSRCRYYELSNLPFGRSLYMYCVIVLCTAGDHWMIEKYELLVFSQCYPDHVAAP